MTYEFRKLSDVDTIGSVSDGLNVLAEKNGEIVKIAASKLSSDLILTDRNTGKNYYLYVVDGKLTMMEVE